MTTMRRISAVVAVLFALTLGAVACTSQPASTGAASQPASAASQPGNADSGGTDNGGTDRGQTEGAADPSQPVRDAGVTTTFGGPSQGDQGSTPLSRDTVCKTVALFWGATIPKGVTYRITGGFGVDPSVVPPAKVGTLSLLPGPCDDNGPVDCLRTTLDAQSSPTCSVVVRVAPNFHEGTGLVFTGTLTCPNRATCHAVETRQAAQGPQVFVCSPAWLQGASPQCDDGTWKAVQDMVRIARVTTTFGGPSQSDQGSKVLSEDTVCKTIGLFWGAAIPDGVTYRIDGGFGADVSGARPVAVGGLTVEPGPCDDQGSVDCLSTTLDAQGSPGTCSVVVRVDAGLHQGTALLFHGTLTCPDQGSCSSVEKREAQQGPAVFVCSPAWLQADSTRQCDAGTWKAAG